jgi:murein DD-endopeptidase MepM/ murein hydrolase activator NlpD
MALLRLVPLPALLAALLAPAPPDASDARYLLPYPIGAKHVLLQGNAGPWGHQGAAEFAFDFQMPIGTAVAAARAGTVSKVEESFANATRKPGEENFVFVDHGDGTYGRYYHLDREGALVAPGDPVVAGQSIARSGDSGASAGPHLHFDVTRGCAEWGCQTVAITFANAGENPLVQGREYEAKR